MLLLLLRAASSVLLPVIFAGLMAPAIGIAVHHAAVMALSRSWSALPLDALPGLYLDVAVSALPAAILFGVATRAHRAIVRHERRTLEQTGIAAASYALVFALPLLEKLWLQSRLSEVSLLLLILGTLAGGASGAMLAAFQKALSRRPSRQR
jgi:hypothetical protein